MRFTAVFLCQASALPSLCCEFALDIVSALLNCCVLLVQPSGEP